MRTEVDYTRRSRLPTDRAVRSGLLGLCVALGGLLAGCASTRPSMLGGQAPLPPAAAAAISQTLLDAVARGEAPGVVAMVVDRDGVLYVGSAGKLDVAGDRQMIPDAIFRMASMTKPVTTIAIMMLYEEGKLGLDDAVAKYLPGFDDLQVISAFNASDGSVQTRVAKRPMTLRHLLTHTSGIGYDDTNPILSRLLKGTKKSELEVPLLHDPGAGWTYGASTRVLGLIVEKLSGKSLEAFFQERIFGPLGMMDTSYAVVASKQGRVATLHRRVDGALQEEPRKTISGTPHPPFRGDGGLYSTAHDYTQLLRMLLNGGRLGPVRLLSERSVEAMGRNQIGALFVTEQPEVDPASSRAFPLGAGRDKFGLGFQITGETEGRSQYRSAGSMSWSGAFNTEFWIDPRVGIGAVLMMQTLPFYDPGAIRTLQEFEAAVYRIPWLSARVR